MADACDGENEAAGEVVCGRRQGGRARGFLRRAVAIEVLACLGLRGWVRLLATIEDPATVTRIVNHGGLGLESPAVPAELAQT